MNTTTAAPAAVSTPHAAALELLRTEAQNLLRRQVRLDRDWNKAISQPPRTYNPDAVDAAETAVKDNRDVLARIRESISTLERAQADREAEQAARSEQLPEAAREAIMKQFIQRPQLLEITGHEYLGNNSWNVDTRIQYAGTDRPEPRAFLLVRTDNYTLLVNP
jgi:hypothetical protein